MSCTSGPLLEVDLLERRPAAVTLRVQGELDLATVSNLTAALRPVIAEDLDIELDCAQLHFIDARGITALLAAQQQLNHGRITISQPSRQVKRVLELCDLLDLVRP
ncbi:MAG: STAS domain-containing protein [Acidimicrobiia bacterium]